MEGLNEACANLNIIKPAPKYILVGDCVADVGDKADHKTHKGNTYMSLLEDKAFPFGWELLLAATVLVVLVLMGAAPPLASLSDR